MDFPILFMFMVIKVTYNDNDSRFIQAYFVVLLWRHAWGAWSVLMSLAMTLTLLSFVTIHYAADDYFDWRLTFSLVSLNIIYNGRFFSSRGYGILLQVFCFSFGWNTIAIAVFRKLQWYPFQFSVGQPYCKITRNNHMSKVMCLSKLILFSLRQTNLPPFGVMCCL